MDGHDQWGRLAQVARPVDAATADLLRRRQLPGVVQRVLLPLLWTAMYALVLLGAETTEWEPCNVGEPCAPDPWSALQLGLLVGAALLVWSAPTLGLPVAAVLGVYDLVLLALYPEPLPIAAPLVGGFLVAVVGTVLQVRARRVPLPPTAVSDRLPIEGRHRLVSRGWGAVEVAAVLLLVASLVPAAVYGVLTARIHDRETRAQDATVRVVAIDEENWVLTVETPGGERTDVGVLDPQPYAVDDRLPALVLPADGPDAQPWVSLRAEPVEEDGWLVLSGAAAALGLGLGWRRWSSLRSRARLLREGGPVWVSLATPDDDGAHVHLDTLRLKARHARTSPVDDLLSEVGLLRQRVGAEDNEADDVPPELRGIDPGSPEFDEAVQRLEEAEERELAADVAVVQAAFALAWREARLPAGWDDDAETTDDEWLAARLPAPPQQGEAERVLLVGDPRPGGQVLVVTHDSLVGPFTPLEAGLPRLSRLLDWWAARRRTWLPPEAGSIGRTGDGEDGLDATGLPGVPSSYLSAAVLPATAHEVQLRPSPWRRAGWAVLLAVPLAFWLVLSEPTDWWSAAWLLLGAAGILLTGLSYAVSGVRIGPYGVVVRGGFMVDVHPWSGVIGARVVDDEVVLAFGLDEAGDVVAAGGRPERGRAAEVAVTAEEWRRAAPAGSAMAWVASDGSVVLDPAPGDEVAERPLWPQPERRYPDPAVSAVMVLYVIAAVAVVVGPFVT